MLLFASAVSLQVFAQDFRAPDPDKWYQIVTRYNGTDQRIGRCIEYYPEGSEHAGMLWSADRLDFGDLDLDYQLWRFEPSPDDPSLYAMICKAAPDGFVNPQPVGDGGSARWYYIAEPDAEQEAMKYSFTFITTPTMSGIDENGVSYCAITTTYLTGKYYDAMNCGGSRQGYAINLWNEDYSEDANEWSFSFVEKNETPTSVEAVAVDTETCDEKVFDLFGRPAAPGSHGIFVIAGRKVVR